MFVIFQTDTNPLFAELSVDSFAEGVVVPDVGNFVVAVVVPGAGSFAVVVSEV
ncbi:MAG: hypothetical protein AAGB12_13070 [Pseudomonadota bacterium]